MLLAADTENMTEYTLNLISLTVIHALLKRIHVLGYPSYILVQHPEYVKSVMKELFIFLWRKIYENMILTKIALLRRVHNIYFITNCSSTIIPSSVMFASFCLLSLKMAKGKKDLMLYDRLFQPSLHYQLPLIHHMKKYEMIMRLIAHGNQKIPLNISDAKKISAENIDFLRFLMFCARNRNNRNNNFIYLSRA